MSVTGTPTRDPKEPRAIPTKHPTDTPTEDPTDGTSIDPTDGPTEAPTDSPTEDLHAKWPVQRLHLCPDSPSLRQYTRHLDKPHANTYLTDRVTQEPTDGPTDDHTDDPTGRRTQDLTDGPTMIRTDTPSHRSPDGGRKWEKGKSWFWERGKKRPGQNWF